MIDSLDLILKKLFTDAVSEALEDSGTLPGASARDVTFGPPDGSHLDPGSGSVLNVFLADVRENRALRTSDRVRLGTGVREAQVPLKLDCHYVVSAWSRDISNDRGHVAEVHRLLYSASAALLRHNPLVARAVFDVPPPLDDEVAAFLAAHPGDPVPFLTGQDDLTDFYALDPILRDWEIPLDTLPPDGFPKLPDFWGLMGADARWRPVAYFVATIPVERSRRVAGPEVRAIGTTLRRLGQSDPAPETFFTVGGVVRRAEAGGELVPARFVPVELSYEREEAVPSGAAESLRRRTRVERTTTDAQGRYVFDRIDAGPITVGPPGVGLPRRVPPLSLEEYDFVL